MNTFVIFFVFKRIFVAILLEKRNKSCNFAKLEGK